MDFPRTAFILGAGLGTRLRPLTEVLPKPLIPLGQQPLIRHAMAHTAAAGTRRFVVNTHHLAGRYAEFFPGSDYESLPIRFQHEPEILETAGGLWNIASLLDPEEPLLVYNGDVLSTLDLAALWQAHRASGAEVTLGLLPSGGPIQVNFDPATGAVRDFNKRLRPEEASNALFTGIYLVEGAFRRRLVPGLKESVVQVWLRMLQEGATVAGAWLDGSGLWRDLGKREEYLRAVAELHAAQAGTAASTGWESLLGEPLVSAEAEIAPSARLSGGCQVGAGCRIGQGAFLEDTILWPGAEIAAGARLSRCIVTGRSLVSGVHADTDL